MAQPHEVLGVAANADEAAINAAFRKAAKQYHPDLNNGDTSGIRRLRRLIAARDFLTRRRWRSPTGLSAKCQLPGAPKSPIRKSVILSFVAAGACALLLVPALFLDADAISGPDVNLPGVSVVQKTSLLHNGDISYADASAPDAGSAELKAIRDLQESPDYAGRGATEAQIAAKRSTSSPAEDIRRAVKGAATLMSRTFQRIASEL